jgi:DNA mismatch repair ATPase MutS
VEISSTHEPKLNARDDFVKVDNTSEKVRYSTLKLQELNAELRGLQDKYERVQRALSEELCQQVITERKEYLDVFEGKLIFF